VSVQETVTGRELYSINTGLSKTPQRVQFSSDGRLLFTATDNNSGASMKVWDAITGQLVRELKPSGDALTGARVITFNRDGSLIAVVAAELRQSESLSPERETNLALSKPDPRTM
jgi:WD40 repeat protein